MSFFALTVVTWILILQKKNIEIQINFYTGTNL